MVIDRRCHQTVTLGSVSVGYSVHNENAFPRDSPVRHMHTPFRAVVAHIRNLAGRREPGSMQECNTSVSTFLLRGRAKNPTLEHRVPKRRFLHFFCIFTTARIYRTGANHRGDNIAHKMFREEARNSCVSCWRSCPQSRRSWTKQMLKKKNRSDSMNRDRGLFRRDRATFLGGTRNSNPHHDAHFRGACSTPVGLAISWKTRSTVTNLTDAHLQFKFQDKP